MTDKILVLTTASSKDEARKIARTLVERLLAACVNIVPQVGSIYRWEGEVEEAEPRSPFHIHHFLGDPGEFGRLRAAD